MINWQGVFGVLRAAFRPELLQPRLVIPDIRSLDSLALRRHGFTGIVIDKDNCITMPHHDELLPELSQAWRELLDTFGPASVLIVSNSAGTVDDPGLIQAESVSRTLGVPVLVHARKKPGCARDVEQYFLGHADQTVARVVDVAQSRLGASQLAPPRLAVIGDRVLTDTVLANRLHSLNAVGILTTRVWTRESLGTRFMRSMEMLALRALRTRNDADLLVCLLPHAR
ncbi:uncharacterized protein L969DRAFT_87724 [Mixia osmundae IAM 14324]|uniref:Phosphatidylglycerophosphatase GEP4, mitochondrial n=1 Tax=Mixia osmundae (strain CBS 9802 / IAM 14324 / JCM 22182 / KY 12970) TaxID=764103 RepID=G7E466_MIXOS|nr:uncharacterized protein L969DRAFT_87724 [Mixia osmundae IAM 14324]KEI39722.1 hypothetical protein L969DRAFT_87724 [Mixia osmundae IAM 14324]GAA97626.1 hypothetical protein E5Q_04304 [Mixia osmundae IAM 14324]